MVLKLLLSNCFGHQTSWNALVDQNVLGGACPQTWDLWDYKTLPTAHTTVSNSAWNFVLSGRRETLIFDLYYFSNNESLCKTIFMWIVPSIFVFRCSALPVSPSPPFVPDDDFSFRGLSITWCRRQEIMPGQSLKDTSLLACFHLWRSSPMLHMRTVPSVYSELFKGLVWRCFALSAPSTQFFSFKWGL